MPGSRCAALNQSDTYDMGRGVEEGDHVLPIVAVAAPLT
jgi:hypothetical protein